MTALDYGTFETMVAIIQELIALYQQQISQKSAQQIQMERIFLQENVVAVKNHIRATRNTI